MAWIDVEGAQREVMRGGGRFLDTVLAVYVEVETYRVWEAQDSAEEVHRHLSAKGMRPVMRDFQADIQYNLVFLREGELCSSACRKVVEAYVEKLEQLVGQVSAGTA